MTLASFVTTAGLVLSTTFSAFAGNNSTAQYNPQADSLRFSGEHHLRNIRQLTFGGNNAEAYWSFDSQLLVFQSDWAQLHNKGCDQIFVMRADGQPIEGKNQYKYISLNGGRTTCAYFLPNGKIIYASTHEASSSCPHVPPMQRGRYAWPLFNSYNIYIADADGSNIKLLIGSDSYDAEATVSPDGKYIIFTSTRSGDLDLWRYEISSGELLQLTSEIGYDGGAFFSPDSKKIVWRASRPEGEQKENYVKLLKEGMVEPGQLQIYVADIDGKNVKQVTDMQGANWAPFFHPSGKKIIFASNMESLDKGGRTFAIYLVNIDGTGLKKITHSNTFDAFPMFSFDGKKIAFSSNRNVARTPSRETNVFVADWIEEPEEVDVKFGK